jgi:hypothetical protein
MPQLSWIVAQLMGMSLPVAPSPSAHVLSHLLTCKEGHTREVRVATDRMGLPARAPTVFNPDPSHDIVLAIGINYGQGPNYCAWPPQTPLDWMDDTRMRAQES